MANNTEIENNVSKTEKSVTETFDKMSNIVDTTIANASTETEPVPVEETTTAPVDAEIPPVDAEIPSVEQKESFKDKIKEDFGEIKEGLKDFKEDLEEEISKETTEFLTEIKKLLETVNHYRHLACGSHLLQKITRETVELFYNDFITYGISSETDHKFIDLCKKEFGIKESNK